MAPPVTYEAPHVQLGRLMVWARREGMGFEDFWQRSLRPGEPLIMVTDPLPPLGRWDAAWCVRWPTDRNDREAWRVALGSAKDGWRRAYEREARTKADDALVALREGLNLIATVAEELYAADELHVAAA